MDEANHGNRPHVKGTPAITAPACSDGEMLAADSLCGSRGLGNNRACPQRRRSAATGSLCGSRDPDNYLPRLRRRQNFTARRAADSSHPVLSGTPTFTQPAGRRSPRTLSSHRSWRSRRKPSIFCNECSLSRSFGAAPACQQRGTRNAQRKFPDT